MKEIKSIFVIEDDPISSFVIKLALDRHPAFRESIEFKNGQLATEYLIKNSDLTDLPELILLDINMPVMDGWSFLEKFSTMSLGVDIPIIMLTSSINPDDMERAQAHELIKGFFSKPLHDDKLEEILTLI